MRKPYDYIANRKHPICDALRRLTIFTITHLVGFVLSHAQTKDIEESWRWVHFSTESGLPSNVIKQIFEDGDGTIWVATQNGIAWFDGFRWNVADSSAISISDVQSKYLLVVARNSEIAVVSKTGRQNLHLSFDYGCFVGEGGDTVLFVKNRSLYVLTQGQIAPYAGIDTHSRNDVRFGVKTRNGAIWINTSKGFYKVCPGSNIRPLLDYHSYLGIGNGGSYPSIEENIHGVGIAQIADPQSLVGLWEWSSTTQPHRISDNHADAVKALDMGPNGEAIVAYRTDDLALRVHDNWKSLSLSHVGIRDISTVKFLSNGNLAVGTEHGLFLFQQQHSRWTNWNHPGPDVRNVINEILVTHSGEVWIATGDGIEVRSEKNGVRYIGSVLNEPLQVVTGLAEDSDGAIWISSGSSFTGAYRWDGKHWKHFEINNDSGAVHFHKILKDRHDRLWFLGIGSGDFQTGFQPGAFVLENGIFKRWSEQEGLPSGRVYAFAEGKDGSLWFGTWKGLCRWRDGRWTRWTHESGLAQDNIFSLTLDDSDRCWFGHKGQIGSGVGYVDQHDVVHYLTTADGLVDNNTWDLRTDDSGKIWIATQRGLSSYNHGNWTSFDERSGLILSRLWPVFPLGNRVYVGTQGKGVAILHTDQPLTPNPRLSIEPPVVEYPSVLLRWRAFSYNGEIPSPEVPCRFRVDNGRWSEWDQQNIVTLTNLNVGDHRVQVQAKGLFGQFDTAGVITSFTIPPLIFLRPLVLYPTFGLTVAVLSLITTLALRKRRYNLSIRASEERYRMITDLMSDYAYLNRIDADGSLAIVWMTESFTRLTGYSVEEAKSPDFMTRFIYPEDLPGTIESIRQLLIGRTIDLEGRIVTKSGTVLWMHNYAIPIIDKHTGKVASIYGIARNITERKYSEERVRMLASQLALTEEKERRRMATYLHDIIGQTLALTKIKLRSLQKAIGNRLDAEPLVQEVRTLIDESIRNTRTLTFELSPPILYEVPLETALRSLAEQLLEQHNLSFSFEDDGTPKPLNEESRIVLFYAAREVIVNTIKHAEATKVTLRLATQNTTLHIDIIDDGQGFDPSSIASRNNSDRGYGLFNLRERLTHLGGTLEISSVPGKGSTISLITPLITHKQGSAV